MADIRYCQDGEVLNYCTNCGVKTDDGTAKMQAGKYQCPNCSMIFMPVK